MKKSFFAVLSMLFVVLSLGGFTSAQTEGTHASTEEEKVVVEDLTYEEATQRIAKYSGRPLEEVKKEHPQKLQSLDAISAACGYGEVSQRLKVSDTYRPRFIAIVNKCRDGSVSQML